jgi:hypothetical protein
VAAFSGLASLRRCASCWRCCLWLSSIDSYMSNANGRNSNPRCHEGKRSSLHVQRLSLEKYDFCRYHHLLSPVVWAAGVLLIFCWPIVSESCERNDLLVTSFHFAKSCVRSSFQGTVQPVSAGTKCTPFGKADSTWGTARLCRP